MLIVDSERRYIPRVNTGGNYCGHSPDTPRFTLAKPAPIGKGGLPRTITLLMERITQYYDSPTLKLPSLNLANGSERQQRSERREACICMLAALLKHTDLTSLRVGIPSAEGFIGLTMDVLAAQTGITLRRCERAVKDLKAAGILTVSQPRQLKEDGTWKGLAAVRAISKHLFGAFGLKQMLEIERKKASKRLKQQAKQWREEGKPVTQTDKERFSIFMGAINNKLDKKPKKDARPQAPPGVDNFEYQRALLLKTAELIEQHPEWNRERLYREAAKQLQGRLQA